jgi:hypothetical protein
MKLRKMLAVAPLALVLTSVPAWTSAADDPCQEAAGQFCQSMKPGDKDYTKCMRAHTKDLSQACKASLAHQRDIEQNPACKADAEKFCPDLKPGGGRMMKCLRTHQGDLSEACKREIGRRTGRQ